MIKIGSRVKVINFGGIHPARTNLFMEFDFKNQVENSSWSHGIRKQNEPGIGIPANEWAFIVTNKGKCGMETVYGIRRDTIELITTGDNLIKLKCSLNSNIKLI